MSEKEKLTERIESLLDELRPFMAEDGGGIKLIEVTEEMDVVVQFLGNCSNCDFSSMTFKAGVEASLKKNIPEINNILTINNN